MASELPVYRPGDLVSIVADHPPILGGSPVVWTVVSVGFWAGTDFPNAVLRPSARSGYSERTVSVGRLVPAVDVAA